MWFVRFLIVLSVVAIVGCGEGTTTMPAGEAQTPADQIKGVLQTVADTGEVDSGLMVAQEQLEAMKATDAAKAEELLADLDALMQLKGEAAKKKATEMLGKL